MRTYTQEEKQAVIDRVISGELSKKILSDTSMKFITTRFESFFVLNKK